jgi:GH25 family lysozyme M1 (1,4-beta-N-acetylmuramidase)
VCWRGKNGHQSLFVREENGMVTSLDGNTTGRARDGTPVYSTVAEKRRASADVLAFYSAPIASAKVGPVPSPARGGTESGLPADQCRGIDVSEHQAIDAVDWHAAARLGYRYGIARLTNGTTRDARCVEHCARIRAAGLTLGGYIFHVFWRTPAEMVAAFTRDADACGYGEPGDLVPWLDLESWQGASGYHQAAPAWSPVAEETAARLAEVFGSVGIYVNAADWAAMGRPTWIGRYPLACAHYTEAAEPLTAGGLQWTWWQHRVAPIPGVCTVRIDQSIARLPLPTIRQAEAPPAHRDEQRIDVGWIDVPWDRAEHDRLRNLAVARHTDEEPP